MPRPARMAQIPELMAQLQFGLQFNTVPRRPGQTDQGRWSSLNRSGQRRPELLMQLGLACRHQGQESLTVFSRTDRTVPDYGVSAGHPEDADLPIRIPAH